MAPGNAAAANGVSSADRDDGAKQSGRWLGLRNPFAGAKDLPGITVTDSSSATILVTESVTTTTTTTSTPKPRPASPVVPLANPRPMRADITVPRRVSSRPTSMVGSASASPSPSFGNQPRSQSGGIPSVVAASIAAPPARPLSAAPGRPLMGTTTQRMSATPPPRPSSAAPGARPASLSTPPRPLSAAPTRARAAPPVPPRTPTLRGAPKPYGRPAEAPRRTSATSSVIAHEVDKLYRVAARNERRNTSASMDRLTDAESLEDDSYSYILEREFNRDDPNYIAGLDRVDPATRAALKQGRQSPYARPTIAGLVLFALGFLFLPAWWVGSVFPWTPSTHAEAVFRRVNRQLSLTSIIFVAAIAGCAGYQYGGGYHTAHPYSG